MDELGIQRGIVAEAVQRGAHAFKSNNRFLVGVLDLHIQWPGLVGCWIEVKLERVMRVNHFANLHLTAKQRAFIVANQGAGGRSGWLLVVRASSRGDYLIECGVDPNVRSVDMRGDTVMRRDRGGAWPVREIVQRIAG